MLKLSLKEGEYVNIGDNIRVVYAGGSGKNGRLMIDAPREMNISRSNNDPNPEKRKDTYQPEQKISEEAQHEIKKIIWNERQKKAKPTKADKKAQANKLIGGCGASHTREAACYRKPQLLK